MHATAKNPPTRHIAPLSMDDSKKLPCLATRAPFTGGPINAAIELKAIPIPIYVPRSRGLLTQMEKAAAAPDMIMPEVNPKTIEYTISAAVVSALFIQKMTVPLTIPAAAIIFKRPNLSARTPGMIRPNVDAPLRIATRYEARVAFMPRMTAYVGMKNSGVNIPKNMKKVEIINKT